MIPAQAKLYVRAVGLFLFLWVVAVLSAAAFMATTEHIEEARQVPPKLRLWSPERIKAELAEADTATDCSAYLGEQAAGVRCSVWQITESFGLMTIESP